MPTILAAQSVQFTNITQSSGINFRHNNGAFGLKLFPESMGSGAAFFDYDGDGWPDLFLVNGRDWTPQEINAYLQGSGRQHQKQHGFKAPTQPPRRQTLCALYRNNRDGTFTDVTRGSGLDTEMFGLGAAVGDYDNDGRPDLYITAYGRNYLFHNQTAAADKPRFVEVAEPTGVRDGGLSTSAAWLDYDKDGKIDLFVGHYTDWKPQNDLYYSVFQDNRGKSYSGPIPYRGSANRLYHNLGNGRFADVSARSGILVHTLTGAQKVAAGTEPKLNTEQGKTLGIAIYDYDHDGWPDILVANDEVPNYLFHNRRDGTFDEVGQRAGLAYSSTGKARGGMGIDTADIDHSGRDSVLIGNYADEMIALFHQADGVFADTASYSEVAGPSQKFVVFGAAFLDVNNDTWPDILTANGHVLDDIKQMRHDLSYAQRPLLFLNLQGRQKIKFAEIGSHSGLDQPIVGRGLCSADIDLDGDLDVLLCNNGGAPLLLRNDSQNSNHAIRLTLQGSQSNRSALDSEVEITFDNPDKAATDKTETLRRRVRSGSSYLSQSELALTIGVGSATKIRRLEIRWPSGKKSQLQNLPVDTSFVVRENKGITSQAPLRQNSAH